MQIKDIMSRRPECLTPESTIMDAAIKMKDINCGFLPICENDRIAGVVTDRDIAIRGLAAGKDPKSTKAKDVMTEGVVYCFEEDDLSTAINKMKNKHIRRLIVLNKDKRLSGILSIDDIAAKTPDKTIAGAVMSMVNENLAG